MRKAQGVAALFIVFIFSGSAAWTLSPAQAQDQQEAQPVRIVLVDGSRLVGMILEEAEGSIRFRTASGVEMTLQRDQIKAIETMRGAMEDGDFVRYDPNRTRLFFAPTARSQRSGQGYFALYEVFFPYVSVGVGNVASLGGGITLIPGSPEQLMYGAAKFTLYERRNMAFAAGAFAATNTGADGSAGFVLGVGTFGPPNRALTLGVGFGFGNGDFEETAVFLIGGEVQLSNNVKLISENYVIPSIEDAVLVSGGIRFFGERLAADFSLATIPAILDETEGFPFLPWIGFAYNFGRGRTH